VPNVIESNDDGVPGILVDFDVPATVAKHVDIFTDGGAKPSHGSAGWGFWAEDSDGTTYSAHGYLGSMSTNNRAELRAFKRALQMTIHMGWKNITILSDSEYVIKGTKWARDKWRNNKWLKPNGDAVPNKDYWVSILDLEDILKVEGVKCAVKKVKGHSGKDDGNNKADMLATLGRLDGEGGDFTESMVVAKTGDAPVKVKSAKFNKMLSGKRLFFMVNSPAPVAPEGRTAYYQTSYQDEVKDAPGEDLGVDFGSTTYSVLHSVEPIAEVEAVLEYQHAVTPDDFVSPVMMYLSNVTKPNVWHELGNYGNNRLKHKRLSARMVDGLPITRFLRPPRNAYRALDKMADLDQILHTVLSSEDNNYEITDITEELYTTSAKGVRKISDLFKEPRLPVSTTYGGKDIKLNLVVGIDLPPKNNMSAIGKATGDLEVLLVKYESYDDGFRYCVVIKSEQGEAIYSSPANLEVA